MTDRPRLDQLTDDQLDQLYAELDQLAIRVWNAEDASTAWERKADEQQARAEKAEAAIARVRALHSRWEYDQNDCSVCVDCYGAPVPYPCPTLRALDGTA